MGRRIKRERFKNGKKKRNGREKMAKKRG